MWTLLAAIGGFALFIQAVWIGNKLGMPDWGWGALLIALFFLTAAVSAWTDRKG